MLHCVRNDTRIKARLLHHVRNDEQEGYKVSSDVDLSVLSVVQTVTSS